MPYTDSTYISQLNDSDPLSGDPVAEGDDHLRSIKHVLKKTFPGVSGQGYNTAILAKESELNNLVGLDEPLVDFIDTTVSGGVDLINTPQIVDEAVTVPKIKLDGVEGLVLALQQLGMAPTAWCVFDGTGANDATQDILAQHNIASVTQRPNNGQYDIVFTTPMTNSNYTISLDAKKTAGATNNTIITMLKRNEVVTENGFTINTEYEVAGDFQNIKSDRTSIMVFGGV